MPGVTLDRLRKTIRDLKAKLDNRCCSFYERLSVRELEQFEYFNKIRLPEDYRLFLTEIGNGGSIGPCREGLLRLGGVPQSCQTNSIAPLHRLTEPFPYTEAYIKETPDASQSSRIQDEHDSQDEDEDDDDDDDDDNKSLDDNFSIQSGVQMIGGFLYLGTTVASRDKRWILVCEGESRGQVWTSTTDGSFYPTEPRKQFHHWINDWIEDGMDDALHFLNPEHHDTNTFWAMIRRQHRIQPQILPVLIDASRRRHPLWHMEIDPSDEDSDGLPHSDHGDSDLDHY